MRFGIAFVLFFLCGRLNAQENLCSTPIPHGDVQLVLSISDGRTTFQQGETIPVALTFTAKKEGAYLAQSRPERWNDRLEYEKYCVSPAVPDPLETYFNGFGGGLDGPEYGNPLSAKPFVAHVELNEFLTLMPDDYEIYAVSLRVIRNDGGGPGFVKHFDPVLVRSNAIRIHVVPATPEWVKSRIREAEQTLTSQSPVTDPYLAARRLRFLITEDGARSLVRNYTTPNQEVRGIARELKLGLFGSPFRDTVLSEMRDQLSASERGVSEDFLDTLSRLQITADPAWAQSPDSRGSQTSYEFARRQADHRIALLNADAKILAAALPDKTGAARAFSAEALIKCCADDDGLAITARRALIESWKYLPDFEQQRLITSNWPILADPAMIPILKQMLSIPPLVEGRLDAMAYHNALKHLFEIDQAQARPFIERDLHASGTKPPVELLQFLSGAELDAAVQPSVDRIAKGHGSKDDFERVGLFASSKELLPVSAAFERAVAERRCDGQQSMIRYFIRVDPANAASKIDTLLRRELKHDCVALINLEDQLPTVQSAVIRALDHSNPWVVRDAADALGRYGTKDAEEALWTRLEKQHQKLSTRASELRHQKRIDDEVNVSQELVNAIGTGTAWLCTPEKLARLRELAGSDTERGYVDMWKSNWGEDTFTISPTWYDETSVDFTSGPASNLSESQLRTRLAVFPRESTIKWQIWNPSFIRQSVQRTELDKFKSWAEPFGLSIIPEILP